jgi:hypothetical protein
MKSGGIEQHSLTRSRVFVIGGLLAEQSRGS